MGWSNVVRSALVCVRVKRSSKTTRWKRASKCQNLIMQFQTQLMNQKNRRHAIINQSHMDIAQLLQIGSFENVLARLEQLYKDTCSLNAYSQIENFCECIITNLSDISICSSVDNLPINVAVAVANLTYAASRCGELSLLHHIRNLFRERYGREFDFANVELSAGNFVDFQLRENLSIYGVPEDGIQKLFNEIAQDLNFPMGFMDLKQNLYPHLQTNSIGQSHCDASDQKPEVMKVEMLETCSDNDEACMQPPRSVTHKKVWSSSPYHIDSRRSSSSKDTSSMKVDHQESSSSTRTSSEGMPRTPSMSISYLDDIDEHEKSVNQEQITGKKRKKSHLLSPMSYVANKRKVDRNERRRSC